MDLGRIEQDIRRVPGVLACQLTAGELTVLVAPDADPATVAAAVRRLLADVAAAPTPTLTVLGGRGVVPVRRGRRGVFALSATSVALLGAAGVAAAVNGVLVDDDRPSLGATAPAGPPATVPPGPTDAVPSLRSDEELATAPLFRGSTVGPTRSTQPPAQLAALGSPALLVFDLPVPGRVVRAPRVERARPEPVSVPTPAPTTPVSVPVPVPTTVPETIVVATPSFADLHDSDRGDRTADSNGHATKGPQKSARGRRD